MSRRGTASGTAPGSAPGTGTGTRSSAGTAAPAGSRVVVIGGGIAGLATAALLARDGHRVTLVERGEALGGRAGTWESGGFRFDTGPSWYLMPEVFEHFFRMMGTSAERELDLVALDPGYRVLFEAPGTRPGEVVDIPRGRAENRALFERLEPGSGPAFDRYLDSAADTYAVASRRFLYSNFESLGAFASREVLARAGRLVRLLAQPLHGFAAGFFRDDRLLRILGYPAVFLGTSPYRAPSIYHLMSHLDLADAVYYPRGGFGTLIAAVERLAREAGVEILTGTEATRILDAPLPRGRRRRRIRAHASGVRVRPTPGHAPPNADVPASSAGEAARSGQSPASAAGPERVLPADIVVSAADLHHTETALLPARLRSRPERRWRRAVPGPGTVLVFLGVRGEIPELEHHTLLFTEAWRENFEAISRPVPRADPASAMPERTSLYVCRPSATDPGVAPEGDTNLFVLVPVPSDTALGAGGDPAVERIAERAIDQIAEWAGIPDLRERILVRRTLGPADFEREHNAWRGTALGLAHTTRQSAFFRGSNRSRRLAGLYYAGATTVPGIGLPMCLISAELVLKRLRGDRGHGPLPEPAPGAANGPRP